MFSVLWRTMLVKIVGSKMWRTFFACISALHTRENVFFFNFNHANVLFLKMLK